MAITADAYIGGCCACDGTFDNLKSFLCTQLSARVATERDPCRARAVEQVYCLSFDIDLRLCAATVAVFLGASALGGMVG